MRNVVASPRLFLFPLSLSLSLSTYILPFHLIYFKTLLIVLRPPSGELWPAHELLSGPRRHGRSERARCRAGRTPSAGLAPRPSRAHRDWRRALEDYRTPRARGEDVLDAGVSYTRLSRCEHEPFF